LSFLDTQKQPKPQPCKYGHNSGRDAQRHCIECDRIRERERYHKDPKAIMMRRATRPCAPSQTPEGRRAWASLNPKKLMLHTARASAKKRGQKCTITDADIIIPATCPLLNIPLEKSGGVRTDASPSLDRIDSKLGYIPGNVWVISWRANRLKNNATLEELQMLVQNLAERLA